MQRLPRRRRSAGLGVARPPGIGYATALQLADLRRRPGLCRPGRQRRHRLRDCGDVRRCRHRRHRAGGAARRPRRRTSDGEPGIPGDCSTFRANHRRVQRARLVLRAQWRHRSRGRRRPACRPGRGFLAPLPGDEPDRLVAAGASRGKAMIESGRPDRWCCSRRMRRSRRPGSRRGRLRPGGGRPVGRDSRRRTRAQGIRVNAVAPLAVEPSARFPNPGLTALAANAGISFEEWIAGRIPLGRAQQAAKPLPSLLFCARRPPPTFLA